MEEDDIMRKTSKALYLETILSGCAYTQELSPGQRVVQKVLEVPGMPKERLFKNSKVCFVRTFPDKGPGGGNGTLREPSSSIKIRKAVSLATARSCIHIQV
jgi:hypothetical protein